MVLLFPGSAYHLLAQSEGLLLILREHSLVSFLLGFRIEHGPVIAAVILDLQGVGADQNLGGANEGVEGTLITLQHRIIANLGIIIFGGIAGHNHQNRNLLLIIASELGFVGQGLENQAFKQCPETGSHITQVIGATNNQAICIADFLQNRGKTVLADTFAQVVRQLAAKTGNTSCELFQFVQIDNSNLCALFFCPFGCFPD